MIRRAIDSAIHAVLIFGITLGIGIAGVCWLIYYLCQHITIGWI